MKRKRKGNILALVSIAILCRVLLPEYVSVHVAVQVCILVLILVLVLVLFPVPVPVQVHAHALFELKSKCNGLMHFVPLTILNIPPAKFSTREVHIPH